jgi:hypothetical protein
MCKLTVDSKDMTVGALFAKIVDASAKLSKYTVIIYLFSSI